MWHNNTNDYHYEGAAEPDIENTEAAVIEDAQGNPHGRIIRLSGAMGKEEIILYPENMTTDLPVPYLGLTFQVAGTGNMIQLTTLPAYAPLQAGDHITFHFLNGTVMQKKWHINSYAADDRVGNIFMITDEQLLFLVEHPLASIELTDSNSAAGTRYYFAAIHHRQYHTPAEGRKLLQIMARRIAGVKLIIMKMKDI